MKIRIEIEIDDQVAGYHWPKSLFGGPLKSQLKPRHHRLNAAQRKYARDFFNHVVNSQIKSLNKDAELNLGSAG